MLYKEPQRRFDLTFSRFPAEERRNGFRLQQNAPLRVGVSTQNIVNRLDELPFRKRPFDEELVSEAILERVQQHTGGGLAVAARASSFLVVRLERPRHGAMDNQP